ERAELVVGDVTRTASAYVSAHPGFRISLLHLDLDTYHATRAALESLFPMVVKGGVVVFDNYADGAWGDSRAVDEYLQNSTAQLRTLDFARRPAAFVIK